MPAHKEHPVIRSLLKATLAYRSRLAGAVVLLLLAKLVTVAVPASLKHIIDLLSRPELIRGLPVIALIGYALLRFSGTLFGELRDLLFARVTQNIVADYAHRTFVQLHALSPRFHAKRQTGGLLRDIDRGTNGIAFLLGTALFTIVPTLVEFALVLGIILTRYSGWFSLMIVATFLCYTGFTVYFTARRSVFQRKVNRLDTKAKSRLADSMINYENVKLFTGEIAESFRLKDIFADWINAMVNNQKALFVLHVGQSAIIAVGVAAVMLLAGEEVLSGRMTVGDLVMINAYVIQICLPLNTLGFVYRQAQDARTDTDDLLKLLDQKPEIVDMPAAYDLTPHGGRVEFKDVSFHYESDRPILHQVSFSIEPGKTVAVVGGSGSGKSTIARLLLRFYDAQEGQILIDGQDIRLVTQTSLRKAIGVVPQDTVLFNDDIAYNIGYGREGASGTQIVAAANAAHVHRFIQSLPNGYHTQVGERGVKLSGGERQRISIARAILKNPPILIFDEATSALDTQSERAIQDELDRISQDRTTLIVAHRLSTIANADLILVLEHGVVVERGTHDELLAREGMYARMWHLQQREKHLAQAEHEMGQKPPEVLLRESEPQGH